MRAVRVMSFFDVETPLKFNPSKIYETLIKKQHTCLPVLLFIDGGCGGGPDGL